MIRRLSALALAGLMLSTPAWADQASAVAAVRQQPKVVDASVDKSGNMYVLVKPESLAWSQYAAYLCKVITPHQSRIFRVRVIDITKAIRTQPEEKWARAGEAACGN